MGGTWATGTLAGVDGITRPLVEVAEGVFLGMMAGAWSLFSNSSASAYIQSQGKWLVEGDKSLGTKNKRENIY